MNAVSENKVKVTHRLKLILQIMLRFYLVVGAVDVESSFVVEVGRSKRVQPVVLDEEVKN